MSIQSVGSGNGVPTLPAGPSAENTATAVSTGAVAQATTQQQEKSAKPSAAEVEKAVKDIESVVKPKANDLQFSIDKGTEKTVVSVVDRSTGEVVRQIPSKEALEIAQNLEKLSGLLFKGKA